MLEHVPSVRHKEHCLLHALSAVSLSIAETVFAFASHPSVIVEMNISVTESSVTDENDDSLGENSLHRIQGEFGTAWLPRFNLEGLVGGFVGMCWRF